MFVHLYAPFGDFCVYAVICVFGTTGLKLYGCLGRVSTISVMKSYMGVLEPKF